MGRMQDLSILVKKHDWRNGAELGVANGQTLFYLLDENPNLHMIGVDAYGRYFGEGNKHTSGFKAYNAEDQVVLMNKVASTISDKYKNRAYIIQAVTTIAAQFVKDDSLDFVFIDADHRESFARADIAAWIPKVKPDGYMTGHDWKFHSVQRALNGMVPGWDTQGSIWFIPKEKVCFR